MSNPVVIKISNDGYNETPKKINAPFMAQPNTNINVLSNTLVNTNKFLHEITETLKHNKSNNGLQHPNKPLRSSIKNGEIIPIKILTEQKEHGMTPSSYSDEINVLSSLYLNDVDYSILDEKEEEEEINYSASKDEDSIKRNINHLNGNNTKSKKSVGNFSSKKQYNNYNENKLTEALQKNVEISNDDFNKDIDDSVIFINDDDKVDTEIVAESSGVLNFTEDDIEIPRLSDPDINLLISNKIIAEEKKSSDFRDKINNLFNDEKEG